MTAQRVMDYLEKKKYEILLVALLVHLYIGIFLTGIHTYSRYIWPISILLLGISSVGVFREKGKWRKRLKNILLFCIVLLPSVREFMVSVNSFQIAFSLIYSGFFAVILYEVFSFLLKPKYINSDLIFASACGYFLLIEVLVFILIGMYYLNPNSFSHLDTTNPATIFMDLVYYSSITMSTIGYGDIAPVTYKAKLLVSFFGVISQFYMVVLIGLLISKFSNSTKK